MKRGFILILILLLSLILMGCSPVEDVEDTPITEDNDNNYDQCSSISDPSRKILCEAMKTGEMELCLDIPKKMFKEECLVVTAELSNDESNLAYCDEANEYNQIICQALVKNDAKHCFTFEQDLGIQSSLSMRDCIDLVARKLQSEEICDYFIDYKDEFMKVCGGATSDCECMWLDGASYNAEDCKENIEQ